MRAHTQADDYGRVYTVSHLPSCAVLPTGSPPYAPPRVVQAFKDPLAGTQVPFNSKNDPSVHRIVKARRFASQSNLIPLDCNSNARHIQVPMPSKTLTHAMAKRIDPSLADTKRRTAKMEEAKMRMRTKK
ncbi:hypothetical protein GL50803_002633 [Giardia duodenalis]|uniref:Uncharacterized protein n=1 Tax=Giardia intestinalis (strain ATCC 50803 / WB clone C6) TaxID=184922 RepID=A8BF37_GIAIC|nr:hypothetical protein GL50803_002633 [Giardia intestinalis]KAE8305693.1 hypothetical protein GL50803_002633 [Giardia intestinalis]|eukprot:XP_001707473.1 Hypothetical protein GL50803_2633 [Giardia lamblia ATCC 50803]